MVKHMPSIAANQQPTIRIITANYCEKLAVYAMMDNITTFVKYKTEGEFSVYTVGFIGEHKCVSTKLPQIGQSRAAQISSGNTTTRLLVQKQDLVTQRPTACCRENRGELHKETRKGLLRTPYIHEGQELMEKQEADLNRAPKEFDKLYISTGESSTLTD
uniref:Uncharacterized protein n=1 Tax=Magallana gigas TaxID=29159 RepID=A0A8W8NBS8_MAGGI